MASNGTLASLGNFISGLDDQATAWYRGVTTGTAVVTPSTSSAQAASQQIAINQAAQANLGVTNPTLAGLLANPTVVILGFLSILIIAFLIFTKT